MFSRTLSLGLASAGLFLLGTMAASADVFDFNFTNDNDVQFFNIPVTFTLAVRTTGYAAGGFDPIISVFSPSGQLIEVNDDFDGPDSGVFLFNIAPGTYTVAVSQFDNTARGPLLSNGFLYDLPGDETFTSQYENGGGTAPFVNLSGEQRTGFQSLTVVPEPGSMALAAGLLVVAGGFLRRRRA